MRLKYLDPYTDSLLSPRLWSAYTGRPSFIVDWDITVQLPREPQDLQATRVGMQDAQAAVHIHILLLTTKCSKILTELYSQKHKSEPESLRKAASSIHTEMIAWQHELPEALKWPNQDGTPTSPQVLVMQ